MKAAYAVVQVYFIWAAMLAFVLGVAAEELAAARGLVWPPEFAVPALAAAGGVFLLLALFCNRPPLLLPLFLALGLAWGGLAQARLAEFAVPANEAVFFEGRVVEVLTKAQNDFSSLNSNSGSGCSFIMQGEDQNGWRGRLLITGAGVTPKTGDVMRLCGLVSEFSTTYNFGLSGSRYFYSQSIAAAVRPAPQGISFLRLAENSPQLWGEELRRRLFRAMEILPARQQALLKGIGFGDTSGLTNGQNGVLSQTGIMHIFAVSGLHIGYVVLLGGWVLRLLRVRRRWLCFAGVALLVLFFALVAGLTASVLRAAIMTLVGGLGALLLQGQNGGSGGRNLVLAAFLLLLWRPNWALQPGFLLSFLATAGIVCTAKYWRRLVPSDLLSIGLAAQFMIMPVAAYFFNTVSLVGLLASPFFALAAGLVVILLLLAMPLTFLGLAYVPLAGAGLLADLLYRIAEWLAGLPGAFVYTLRPGWPALLLYYLLVGLALYFLRRED